MQFPATVAFYELMGIQAARHRSGAGGGFRLYVLAKALATTGLDTISRDDLRAYALSLGASPRQWQRWIAEARGLGLMRDVQSKSGEWRLILPNPAAAGHALKCETIGGRKAIMQAVDLIGKGWRSRVFAAYEVGFNARPITRERMQKIANVPTRTQRYRDNQAGVHRQRNYAKSNMGADVAPMLQEHSDHRAVFVMRDGKAAWRLPDIRTHDRAMRGPVGRARKANKILAQLQQNGSFQKQRPLSDVSAKVRASYIRLFHYTQAGRKAALRKLARQDHRIREIYEWVGRARTGVQLWMPYGAATGGI